MISIIVPCFNEQLIIEEFITEINKVINKINYQFEIILIDNNSLDQTWEKIRSNKDKFLKIKFIKFSNYFGKEAAILAGLDHASGDAVIVIDSDLQDPPEVIPQLVEKWRDGNDVVNAKRIKRKGEGLLKKITSYTYYRLLFHLSDIKIPMDTGDFRLLNRNALNAVLKLREKHRYMKGLFAWVGFKQQEIQYEREARYKGKTKWSFFALFNMAFSKSMLS